MNDVSAFPGIVVFFLCVGVFILFAIMGALSNLLKILEVIDYNLEVIRDNRIPPPYQGDKPKIVTVQSTNDL